MKPSSVAALVIGLLVSMVVIALHATRVTLPLERVLANLLTGGGLVTGAIGIILQYLLVVLLSLGTAWIFVKSARRKWLWIPVAILLLELVAFAWIGQLFGLFFQPLPSIVAVGLSAGLASGYTAFSRRSRSTVARTYFRDRLSDEQRTRLASGELVFEPKPKVYEATVVVCDISNKHDLADEHPPDVVAEITEKFIRHATGSFLEAGAYLEAVNGEGIVAIFGFPAANGEQAEKATRHALSLLQSFDKLRETSRDETYRKFGVHFGISSGCMTFAPLEHDGTSALLATGEPVELARRFCIANRFYGSRILIGPQTFELCSQAIIARPIDFLSGVDVRERHEIYEPLKLAGEATEEEIARRDSFWNGVVLYREKRWGEAYSQFQKARGPNEWEDQPLQLYLRRIEPLALHLVEAE